MATGGAGTTVSVSSISASSTATGSYVVVEGESSSDLSVSSLAIGGAGSITDAFGNELSASPSIVANANLDDAEAIVINGTRPTIASITSSTADGTYGIGEDINVTITFSEAVTLNGGTLDLVLDAGTTLNFAAFSDANTATINYTVVAGDETTNLSVASNPSIAGGVTLRNILDNSPNDLTDFATPAGQSLGDLHTIAVEGIRPCIE